MYNTKEKIYITRIQCNINTTNQKRGTYMFNHATQNMNEWGDGLLHTNRLTLKHD